MLNVKSTKLSESDLKLPAILFSQDNMSLLNSIAESANWNIDKFLSESTQLIKKSKGEPRSYDVTRLLNYFRKVLIAKKYGIDISDKGRSKYFVVRATDDCIIIQKKGCSTSIILSPIGELIMDEGNVFINERSLTPNGYNVKRKSSFGLFSKKCIEILPCIFDCIKNNLDGSLYVVYKNVEFRCMVRYTEDLSFFLPTRACFAFDSGIVLFMDPKLSHDVKYHNCGVHVRINHHNEIDLREEENIINKVCDELFAKISLTHHRLTKEEIEQLTRKS